MSKTLYKTTELWRCDTESEAEALIAEAKKDSTNQVVKSTSEYKERKQKGECVEAWYRVTIVRQFDDEKEPVNTTRVNYTTDAGFFPQPLSSSTTEEVEEDYDEEDRF